MPQPRELAEAVLRLPTTQQWEPVGAEIHVGWGWFVPITTMAMSLVILDPDIH